MSVLPRDIALRRIDLRDVPTMTPLPAHIYDQDGHILAAAGAILDERQVEFLLAVGGVAFVGHDWPRTGDIDAGPDRGRLDQTAEFARDRQPIVGLASHSNRRAYLATISFDVYEKAADQAARRHTQFAAVDISSSGLAFECDAVVREGAEVTIGFDYLPGAPRIVGVVRNCVQHKGRRRRVNVQFTRVLN